MTIQIFRDIPTGQLRYGIFDFDNGIVDTESVFAEFDCDLLNEVLEQAGFYPDLLPKNIRLLAGNSGSEKLKIIADSKNFDPNSFLEEFNARRTDKRKTLFADRPVAIAEGLHALLDHLGERRALATNKKEAKLIPDMKAMGITGLFNVLITSDGLNKKPAPDVILKALEALSAASEQSVYFGDNVADIEAAIAADICAVGFIIEGIKGHEDRVKAMQSAGAHAVTDNYRDMISFFCR